MGVMKPRRKRGARSTGPAAGASITGDKALDRALAQFETRVRNKYIRQALNGALKIVETRYKQVVPVLSGAMRDAVVRRTPKGGKRGVITRALMITRASLAKAIRRVAIRGARAAFKGRHGVAAERTAAVEAASAEVDINERGFYPAIVELGSRDKPGQRPLREALYGAIEAIRAEFVKYLRAAVAAAGK